ncbi:MAG: hypothetical protein JO103_11040 [Candidatus Eremiobacteraeota bacterium]|nr:hypothetical protein [Candidatus Eremiobacteraeota bacterium]
MSIGRITPSGVITEFPTGAGTTGVAAGPDGKIWFTLQAVSRIGWIDPNNPGAGATTMLTPLSGETPQTIITANDGNLWYTDQTQPRIVRVTPGATPTFTVVPTPFAGEIDSLAVGGDGNIWFTDFAGALGKIVW